MLVLFVGFCLAISAMGGQITADPVNTWYQGINKPSFNPPDWIFAPVWVLLYTLIGISGWRVWMRGGFVRNHKAFLVYVVQVLMTLLWSTLFFGAQEFGLALAEIIILWVLIVVNIRLFWKRDALAGQLLLPYLAWVMFASVLNWQFIQANPDGGEQGGEGAAQRVTL